MSLLLPVRYPAKLYSYTDTGAPQLASIDGAIKTILKACLVTGYGTKPSAGWISLFEDANRIVLRLPASTNNYPDLKVENGAGKYRIVSQDNPSGLDDAVEITSVPLLSKDSATNKQWHLIATDIGFILFYHMAENGYSTESNRYSILYCAPIQKIHDSQAEAPFVITYQSKVSTTTGIAAPWISSALDSNAQYMDMRTGALHSVSSFLSISSTAIAFAMHKCFVSAYTPVFFASIYTTEAASRGVVFESDGRSMFAYTNSVRQALVTPVSRVIFTPIDYWEQ